MRWVTLAANTMLGVVMLAACGSSKSDFLNDDHQVDATTGGGSGNQTSSTASAGGSGGTNTTAGDSGTTSGAGGTGGSGSGGAGATSGDMGTTGSSGGDASNTTNTTGQGGTGGAPDGSCRKDADCGLATNAAECCATCAAAYPNDVIASDPCLVAKGETDSKKCDTPVCTDVLCPAVVCDEPVAAVCKNRQCVATYECPEGTLLDRGSCVPPCTSHDDCVVATRSGDCCGGCPSAYHRQVVEADPCLVPSGKPAPEACLPDPEECSLVLCPDILCVEPGSPVCDERGMCAMTMGFRD